MSLIAYERSTLVTREKHIGLDLVMVGAGNLYRAADTNGAHGFGSVKSAEN